MRAPGQRLPQSGKDEDGFMLIAVIVMVFLVLLVLSIAAPRMAMQLTRERDLEAKHRGEQYAVAIRKFYGTFGRYPSSVKELEQTNNQRFLRQEYVDPLTGKSDWRLIHLGENKTTVKGLFGQDLPGVPGGGSAPGLQGGPAGALSGAGNASQSGLGLTPGSTGPGGAATGPGAGSASAFGNNLGGTPGSNPGSSLGSNPGSTSGIGLGSGSGNGAGSRAPAGTGNSNGFGGSSLGGLPTTGGLIIGVGVPQSGDSVASVNGEQTYQKWEFLYDPRIEQLRAGWSVFGGGGGGSTPATGLGNGVNGAPGTAPGSGFGANGGAFGGTGGAFGTGGGGAFGNGQPPGTPTGTPGTAPTGIPPAPNPQAPQNPGSPQKPGEPINPLPSPPQTPPQTPTSGFPPPASAGSTPQL